MSASSPRVLVTCHANADFDSFAAMLAALKQTNDFVLSQGKPLDPMSKAAYEDILAHSAQNGENA